MSTQLLETRQVFPSNQNLYESRTGGTGDGKDLLGQLAHPPSPVVPRNPCARFMHTSSASATQT